MTGVIRRGDPGEGGHVTMEAEIGGSNQPGLLANTRNWVREKRILPYRFQREPAPSTP